MMGGFTAIAGVAALLVGLAIVDERVRAELSRVVSGRPPTEEILSFSAQVKEFLGVLWQALQDQSVENAPLVIFSVAAFVLVVWMTRT
jgi:hypothetical protein